MPLKRLSEVKFKVESMSVVDAHRLLNSVSRGGQYMELKSEILRKMSSNAGHAFGVYPSLPDGQDIDTKEAKALVVSVTAMFRKLKMNYVFKFVPWQRQFIVAPKNKPLG